jgi:AraC family transcriptional regulator of adaptative response/methylated-DNA-[protein]-cysteine methyltransferase
LPLERNVAFYATAAQARAAGFRPCKRCRPDDAAGALPWLADVRRLLEGGDERLTLQQLAAAVGVSRAHLQRAFTRDVGVSPRRYAAAVREARLRANLRDGATVTDATYASGFGSASRVYEGAASSLGMTPARYRRGATGATIHFGIVSSPLGIAHVALGDSPDVLEATLRAEFPSATFARADDRVESATSAIVRYLASDGPWPQLPLDVRATAFQARVWEALRALAPGKTTSYGELARALGDPNATRAVARACATNPVALLIPCHRVLAKDGALTGYRWGVERKAALLDLERRSA